MKLIVFVTEDGHADASVDSQVEQAHGLVKKVAAGALAITMDLERYERL